MKRALLAVLLLGSAVGAAPALAHGGIVETSIQDRQSLAAAPASFDVTFEHASAITSLTLLTADKAPIALEFRPSKAMTTRHSVPLPKLAPGSYTLAWKSLAKDGHVMPGAVSFTVAGD
jgi:copper resistance protein C